MKFWLSLLAAFAIVAGVTVAVPVAVEIDSAASLLQEPRVEPEHASLKPTCSGSTPTITGTSGDDVLVGTPGDDVIVGRGGDDTIDGRGGNDIIIGGAGDDTIRGGNGDDLICGNKGVDTLSGNGGADRISGSSGADIISGGGGDDVLFGGSDADQISGNAGADTISGGADDDQLNGQGDNDVMFGDGGADVIQGRGGNDELWGSGGADEIRGGEGDDFIAGGAGQDRLFGSAGADEIQGDNGNDRLWGGPGDDVLNGLEGGNDRIVGGDGTDTCTGETPAECEIGDGAPELEMACSFVANADTADFSWNGAIDATRYDLQRSDDGATWVEVTRKSDPQATQLSHQVTDFTADSQYRLTIINNRQLIGVETCEDSTEPVGDAGVSAPVCAADAPLIGEPTAIVAWSLDIGDTFEVDRSLDNGATWELEALFLRANLGGGENVNRDPDIKNLYRVRYIENGEEVRLLECGNSFPDEPPVGPQPLPVPRLYVTSDGTSEVEVAWSALSSDVAQVEVFRDGTSIGTTSTGSITEAPDFGPLVFTYTAQSVGADGNRSDMS